MLHFLLGLVHVIVCFALIFFILIQSNKGMGLSGAFGAAGASDSVFGATGGLNVLIKITIGLSLVFVITCCTLSFVKPTVIKTDGSIVGTTAESGSIQDLINTSRTADENTKLPAGQQSTQQPAQSAPQQ